MPSERVARILLSKSDIEPGEIERLTEAQAWRLVYGLPKPKRNERLQICFTGFGASQKEQLADRARSSNLRVVRSVTKSLSLLVCGSNAGPKKIEKAGAQGVVLLEASEFEAFLETGEIADS